MSYISLNKIVEVNRHYVKLMSKHMYSRHYRYNPLFSNPTISDVKDPLRLSFFATIIQARAFLTQVACLNATQLSDPQMQSKIEAAKKIVAKAERRNTRRKLVGRNDKKKPNIPAPVDASYTVGNCSEAQKSVEDLCDDIVCGPITTRDKKAPKVDSSGQIAWEEVAGPKDGDIVRFKLIYHKDGPYKGQLKDRKRTQKETPKRGEIILDLTSGVKAWQIPATGGKREPIPVTKQMEDYYKKSNLYRVRQLAAGYISLDQFAAGIKGEAVAAKRLLRKKKKS